jgi:hypothetical protein
MANFRDSKASKSIAKGWVPKGVLLVLQSHKK